MPLLYINFYNRKFIQHHPEWLFVFGDNFMRDGRGGQAAEARGEPNAVGIPTKRSPGMEKIDFLTNENREEWETLSAQDMIRLHRHILDGGIIVWPLRGIGSGLAQLEERAPDIDKAIRDFIATLEMDSRKNMIPSK